MAKRVHDLAPKCPARMIKQRPDKRATFPKAQTSSYRITHRKAKKEGPGRFPALLYIKIKVSYLAGVVLAVSAVEA